MFSERYKNKLSEVSALACYTVCHNPMCRMALRTWKWNYTDSPTHTVEGWRSVTNEEMKSQKAHQIKASGLIHLGKDMFSSMATQCAFLYKVTQTAWERKQYFDLTPRLGIVSVKCNFSLEIGFMTAKYQWGGQWVSAAVCWSLDWELYLTRAELFLFVCCAAYVHCITLCMI